MTATLKPKVLSDFYDDLCAIHPDATFQQPIPVNNSTSALMRVLTTKDRDTVKAWYTLAGYEADVQASANGYIVEFWKGERRIERT